MKTRGSLCALVALLTLAGCGAGVDPTIPGPLMRPGENCLRCHRQGDPSGAPVWSAAGTVYASDSAAQDEGVEGVSVTLTDAEGKQVQLTTNAAGNFYTAEPLTLPYTAVLEWRGKRVQMPIDVPAGSCNACHSVPSVGGASGRITAPH